MAVALAAVFCVIFASLGTWQVKRRAWKLALISRVEHRVHAPPARLPDPARWPLVTSQSDEYRHVSAAGVFLDGAQTLVQAVTDRGAGYWVLTPLRLEDGNIVLVNRGFVPVTSRDHVAPAEAGRVTGLLRMSEPGGAFLRRNQPTEDRWYSRDVQEISRARGLVRVAPFFIDADAGSAGSGGPDVPLGGLTVVRFHNSHLVYAITWYTLALMAAAAVWVIIRDETHS
jgi:surfeit locus 1 family protein